jgi:hypothetical protein
VSGKEDDHILSKALVATDAHTPADLGGQRIARACARGAPDGTFCPPLQASGPA